MDQKTSKPYPLKIDVPWCERCGCFMDVTVRHVQVQGSPTPTLKVTVRCPRLGKRKPPVTKELMSYEDDAARDHQAGADSLLAAIVREVDSQHR